MRQVKSEYVNDRNHLNIPYKNDKSINERLVEAYIQKQTVNRTMSKKLSKMSVTSRKSEKKKSLPMEWKDSFNALVEDIDDERPPDLQLNKFAASS